MRAYIIIYNIYAIRSSEHAANMVPGTVTV